MSVIYKTNPPVPVDPVKGETFEQIVAKIMLPIDWSGLPKRSPLHEQALCLDELKLGIEFEQYNWPKEAPVRTSRVISNPYFKAKFNINTQKEVESWFILVTTFRNYGRFVNQEVEELDLSVMGLIPSRREGDWSFDAFNYILEV